MAECLRSPNGHHEYAHPDPWCLHCSTIPLHPTGAAPPVTVNGAPRLPHWQAHNPTTWHPNRNPTRAQRLVILALLVRRDGGVICFYCERPLGPIDADPKDPDAPTIDHVLPRSRGGGWELENLVIACRPCNVRKRDELHELVHLVGRLRRALRATTTSLERAGVKIERLTSERDAARSIVRAQRVPPDASPFPRLRLWGYSGTVRRMRR